MSLEKIRMASLEAGTTGRIAFPGVFCRVAKPRNVRVQLARMEQRTGSGCRAARRAASHEQVPFRRRRPGSGCRRSPDSPGPVTEEIAADRATGRVLCADVIAGEDIPGFDLSVVDGFAVRAEDTAGSSEAIPALLRCTGRVAMGHADAALSVTAGTCVYIPTGGVLPREPVRLS